MKIRRFLVPLAAAVALLISLVAAPPAQAVSTTSDGYWACVAVDGITGICLSNPLPG